MLKRVGEMDAVELDRDQLALLANTCGPLGTPRIHHADALKFNFRSLCDQPQCLHLVSILPYNISMPLLFHLI